MKTLKQLFCRHEFRWQITTGMIFPNIKVCKKCGLRVVYEPRSKKVAKQP